VKVRDRLEETNDFSKFNVHVYLLQECLRESISVFLIFFFWSIEDLLFTLPDSLVGEVRLPVTPCFLAKPKGVAPNWRFTSPIGEGDFYRNLWIASRSQATNLRQSSTVFNGFLEPSPFWLCDVAKEAKDIYSFQEKDFLARNT
jgi:hypothetical protein